MTGTPFLETVVRKRLSRFRKCLVRASARAGEEEIHDLRVAIRRLLAGFAVMATLLEKKEYAAGTRKRLKSLMGPLGRLRDAQVKMLWLKRALPAGDEPSYQYALSVANDVQKWRKRALAALHAADPSRFDFALRREDVPHLPRPELRGVAVSLLGERRRGVESLRAQAGRESDPESLHRMRLAFKRYRYCAEIFAPLFPRVTGVTLDRLHSFQTVLGNLHDFDTILEDAGRFLTSVIRSEGDPGVLSRFRELRHREFMKVQPILSVPDGLSRKVFGNEFDAGTGDRGNRQGTG